MFLDEDKAQERLNSPNNLANKLAEFRKEKKLPLDKTNSVLNYNPARKLPRLPKEIKEEIVDKALSGQYTQQQIAEEYRISQPAVGYLKRKAEEKIEAPFKEQQLERDKFLESSIKDTASEKMLLAMGLITEEKLASLKAPALARVSYELAHVLGTVAPKNSALAANINLVVYSPEVRDESSYAVVEIKAQE